MLNRMSVQVLGCDAGAPAKIKKANAALQQRATKLDDERAEIDSRLETLKTAALTTESIATMNTVRNAKIVTWQTELVLRDDYAAWLRSYLDAAQEMQGGARDQLAATQSDLRSKLVAIGYVDYLPETEGQHGRITPGMLHIHPAFRSARDRVNEVDALTQTIQEHMRTLNNGRQKTIEEMDAYRNQILSVA